MQRPTAITVIGWVYVGFGILMIFSGALFSLVAVQIAPASHAMAADPHELVPFRLMDQFFRYSPLLVFAQFIVATLLIVSGAALLRRRSWARPLVEALAWLGLAYVLAFGTFWLWSVVSLF